MSFDKPFWIITSLILLLSVALGFGIIPEWITYYQSPNQRYEYLIESVWCPI